MYVTRINEGQLKLPVEIQEKLRVGDGDKVAFVEEDGKIVLVNSTVAAFYEIQQAFEGEAERLGLKDMDEMLLL